MCSVVLYTKIPVVRAVCALCARGGGEFVAPNKEKRPEAEQRKEDELWLVARQASVSRGLAVPKATVAQSRRADEQRAPDQCWSVWFRPSYIYISRLSCEIRGTLHNRVFPACSYDSSLPLVYTEKSCGPFGDTPMFVCMYLPFCPCLERRREARAG